MATRARLGEVVEILPGTRVGGEGGAERRPYLLVRDLDDGRARPRELLDQTAMTERQARTAARSEVRLGDVVLSCRGTVDKAAIVGSETVGALASANLLVLRPDPKRLDTRVLFAFLSSASVRASLAAMATGVTIKAIRPRDVANLEIVLLPLERQRQLGDLVEAAEEQYRTGIDLSHARRQLGHETVLAQLVEGSR